MCQLLFSAVIECADADAAHGLGGLIVADGGCKCPGDVAKVRLRSLVVTCVRLTPLVSHFSHFLLQALGAGADFW
jgi:hypothetical protein